MSVLQDISRIEKTIFMWFFISEQILNESNTQKSFVNQNFH